MRFEQVSKRPVPAIFTGIIQVVSLKYPNNKRLRLQGQFVGLCSIGGNDGWGYAVKLTGSLPTFIEEPCVFVFDSNGDPLNHTHHWKILGEPPLTLYGQKVQLGTVLKTTRLGRPTFILVDNFNLKHFDDAADPEVHVLGREWSESCGSWVVATSAGAVNIVHYSVALPEEVPLCLPLDEVEPVQKRQISAYRVDLAEKLLASVQHLKDSE